MYSNIHRDNLENEKELVKELYTLKEMIFRNERKKRWITPLRDVLTEEVKKQKKALKRKKINIELMKKLKKYTVLNNYITVNLERINKKQITNKNQLINNILKKSIQTK